MVVDGVSGKYTYPASTTSMKRQPVLLAHEARKFGIQARKRLTPAQRRHQSQRIFRRVLSLIKIAGVSRVGTYLSSSHEVSTNRLNSVLCDRGLQVLAPRVAKGASMFWSELAPRHFFRRNHYRIREPRIVQTHNSRSPCQRIDFLIVPLSAFDAQCHRTGMGGGYYDREIARLRKLHDVICVGLAFEQQRCSSIQSQAWDQSMDFVVTPSHTFVAQGSITATSKTLKPLRLKGNH